MPRSGDTATRAEQEDVRNGTMNMWNYLKGCVREETPWLEQGLHLLTRLNESVSDWFVQVNLITQCVA